MGLEEFFFDSYAAIEIIKKNPSYEKYLDKKIRITFLNLIEIAYIIYLDRGQKDAEKVLNHFKEFVIEVPEIIIINALVFRAENKKKSLSYADCLGYEYAKHFGLLFLTGDDAFKNLPNVEFVK